MLVLALLAVTVLPSPVVAGSHGTADIAALQIGLRQRGLYGGDVDGQLGAQTIAAVRALQRRAGLAADGVPGDATRAALGRFGQAKLGSRVLAPGASGWDVAQLQFLLAWHGFPSGTMDGSFGARLESAVRRFQRWGGLEGDGRAGPAVLAKLRAAPPSSPISLSWPLRLPVDDSYGPRGARFHSGIDFSAATGTPIVAAGSGRVTYAGPLAGGWGNVVTVAHSYGVRTMSAHLSAVHVRVGQRVAAGETVGLVGSSGNASGPHLHFEVRIRGAAIDPLTALS